MWLPVVRSAVQDIWPGQETELCLGLLCAKVNLQADFLSGLELHYTAVMEHQLNRPKPD
jgi:hypothetical protein